MESVCRYNSDYEQVIDHRSTSDSFDQYYIMVLEPEWLALIGTVLAYPGLKVVEHWLGKNKVKSDDATQIRDELRLEITAQREEIKQLEADVFKWREDYYKLYEKYIALQTDLTITLENIKKEAVQAEQLAKTMESQPPETPSVK